MRLIYKVIKNSLGKEPNIGLGRWNITYDHSELIKQNMANHDHCGCCGTPENLKSDVEYVVPKKTDNVSQKSQDLNSIVG